MKVYKKIILDKNNKVIYEDSYDYKGNWSYLGIHYDYKSTRGAKAMEKQAKRERKLAERKAKRAAKEGPKAKEDKIEMHDINKTITLEDLTNPEKKQLMDKKRKALKLELALKRNLKKRKIFQKKMNSKKNK